jgi:anti-anti-sigma factor
MLATHDEWAAAPDFHVWVDLEGDLPCVGVSGELDLLTCAPFRDALADAIDAIERARREGGRRHAPAIAVDMSRLTFLGSTGIREIVRALRSVDRIELRAPTSIVRRALEAAALGPQIEITG